MMDTMFKLVPSKSTPECCRSCVHLIYDYDEWVGDMKYCNIGTWLPYKKQTCKRQQPKGIKTHNGKTK